MSQYTVVSGDTLSGIAKKLGLSNYSQLTGYRSGNPNLIYPGEVLSYGSPAPAPAPTPAPAAPAAPTTSPMEYFNTASAALDKQIAQNKTDLTNFYAGQNTALQQGVESTNAKYNVPGLANVSSALQARISDLQGNLSGTGAGGYASSAQVDKALNTKYLPRYQTAQGQLQTAQGLASTDIGYLVEQQSREATGYTTVMEQGLTTLLTKFTTGVQLSQAEAQRLQDLALKEKEFEVQLRIASEQNATTLQAAQISASATKSAAAITAASPTRNTSSIDPGTVNSVITLLKGTAYGGDINVDQKEYDKAYASLRNSGADASLAKSYLDAAFSQGGLKKWPSANSY